MSLEDAITKQTAAIERNSELLEKLVARAEAAGAVNASAAADTASKGGKGSKASKGSKAETEENTETSGPTHDDVKKLASAWLGEFKGVEGDPETGARREAILGALAKLVGKEGAQVADVPVAELHRVVTWIEKQKTKDNGFGAGRLTEKPGAADAGGGDDEI